MKRARIKMKNLPEPVRTRGDITLKIFSAITEIGGAATDVIDAILSSPYGASYAHLDRAAREHEHQRMEDRRKYEEFMRQRQRYHQMMSALKHDGLINEDKKKGFVLTALGRIKFKKLKKLKTMPLKSIPRRQYSPQEGGQAAIVSFDIPEKFRRKREWLRETLYALGFHMIHESTFIGAVTIPASFITDLRDLEITDFVEIFQVTKHGTLRHIV